MKGTSIIFTILTFFLFGSCMAPIYDDMHNTESIRVNGIVEDENEKPLNHIRIRMEWDSPYSPMVVYSSPKGNFTADLEFIGLTYPVRVSVEISDIDGEENGGLFQTRNDEFTILEENYAGNFNSPIVYRLTHATASESSPQSL